MVEDTIGAITVLSDQGSGRLFLVCREVESTERLVGVLAEALATSGCRVVQVVTPRVTDTNWRSLAGGLRALLTSLGVKQVSWVAEGGSSALVQYIAAFEPRSTRYAILFNPQTRAHPSTWERMVTRVERYLPLGLPLRRFSAGFDGASFLQRIRCPVLVVTTPNASAWERSEGAMILRKLPTAWGVDLTNISQGADIGSELSQEVLSFIELPARAPQKRRKEVVTVIPPSSAEPCRDQQ